MLPSLIHFDNGQVFNTRVYEAEFIGVLPASDKAPFMVLAGRECHECDAITTMFIRSPSDSQVPTYLLNSQFPHPGSVANLDGVVLSEQRAFIGDCVSEAPVGIVLFGERVAIINNQYVGGAVLAYVDSDTIMARRLEDDSLRLRETLFSVASGTCREIQGKEQRSYEF